MTSPWMIAAFLGVIAGLTCWGLVSALIRWGSAYLLDVPNERSLHEAPVPRGGGAAIVLVALGGITAAALLSRSTLSWPFVVAALAVALVSVYDDVKSLGTGIRLAVQVLASLVVLWSHFPGSASVALPGAVSVTFPAVTVAGIGLFWVVGLTNVYNFMDGVDGMAGAQGVAAGVGWAVVGAWLGDEAIALIGVLIAGATLGFLAHNWSPARIFLGDVGSSFLGFVFAGLVLVAGHGLGGRIPLAALLFVWPFGFDGAYTLLRRLADRENLFRAHRSHLYQRLVLAGWSHAKVSKLYGSLGAVCTLGGLGWLSLPEPFASWLASLALLGTPMVLLERVSSVERRQVRGPANRLTGDTTTESRPRIGS